MLSPLKVLIMLNYLLMMSGKYCECPITKANLFYYIFIMQGEGLILPRESFDFVCNGVFTGCTDGVDKLILDKKYRS